MRAAAMSFKLDLNFHGNRVPLDLALIKVAHVAEQGRCGGAEAEGGVFDYRTVVADGVDEVGVVGVLLLLARR